MLEVLENVFVKLLETKEFINDNMKEVSEIKNPRGEEVTQFVVFA